MGIYIFIIVLFSLGILTGALLVRGLEDSQSASLDQYFSLFLDSYNGEEMPEGATILGQSLRLNFQYLLIFWLLGFFMFGFPLIIFMIGLRGFSVGFTVGFLVDRAALQGVLLALGSVLPHNLLVIPALIVAAVTGFSFSWLRFKGYLDKRPYPLRKHALPYTLVSITMGLLMLFGSLVEAYITPVFTRLLVPML